MPSKVITRATDWRHAALALMFAAAALGVQAQQFGEERVKASAVVGSAPLAQGATVRAAVEIRVGDGFHINANPASEEFLIPTSVALANTEGIELVSVTYPDPLEKSFGFWPGTLKVWEGSVVAGVVLRIADTARLEGLNLEFLVDYQACNDEACFAPSQTQALVPVEIAANGAAMRAVESPLLERAVFPGSR